MCSSVVVRLAEAFAVDKRLTPDLLPPRGTSGRLFHDLQRREGNLYDYLKHEREAVLAKLDGLS